MALYALLHEDHWRWRRTGKGTTRMRAVGVYESAGGKGMCAGARPTQTEAVLHHKGQREL